VIALYALALLVSAALLFLLEPMVGKFVLPLLGSASEVWPTTVLFFQAALLAGYGFAHVTTPLSPRRQGLLQPGRWAWQPSCCRSRSEAEGPRIAGPPRPPDWGRQRSLIRGYPRCPASGVTAWVTSSCTCLGLPRGIRDCLQPALGLRAAGWSCSVPAAGGRCSAVDRSRPTAVEQLQRARSRRDVGIPRPWSL
jgi:hypothetical protein